MSTLNQTNLNILTINALTSNDPLGYITINNSTYFFTVNFINLIISSLLIL